MKVALLVFTFQFYSSDIHFPILLFRYSLSNSTLQVFTFQFYCSGIGGEGDRLNEEEERVDETGETEPVEFRSKRGDSVSSGLLLVEQSGH